MEKGQVPLKSLPVEKASWDWIGLLLSSPAVQRGQCSGLVVGGLFFM